MQINILAAPYAAFSTECFVLVGSAMFGETFKPGFTCRTIMMFGTLKDSSLNINSCPLNNCSNYRNVLQNSVNACQIKKKKKQKTKPRLFVIKLRILFISDHRIWFKFGQHVV